VPAVVQADLAHAGLPEKGLPGVPVRLPLDRSAVGLREDEIVVLPERSCGDALLQLGGSVGDEGFDELLR
jgi:hypothetical protein